jgi:hypothetical protein
MDEKNKHINNRLGEQLPSHSPDPEMWQRLSAKLDAMDAEAAYQERLQGLPVHSPDQGTWTLISSRLNRIAYYKTGLRIAVSVAAGLLLLITVSRISDQYQGKENNARELASQKQQNIPVENIKAENFGKTPAAGAKGTTQNPENKLFTKNTASDPEITQKSGTTAKESEKGTTVSTLVNNAIAAIAGNKKTSPEKAATESLMPDTGNIANAFAGAIKTIQTGNNITLLSHSISLPDETVPDKAIINIAEEPKSILFEKEPIPATNSTYNKLSSPPPAILPARNKNHVALAMNYLPENIYNGTNNSLFHNVDLTASYNKDKVRFNTSLGMAYNEEQIKFEMKYDINTPVTAMGPGGHVDTLSYNISNMQSEYMGTEKHKYVTYNLGIGRRLYTKGKFSTWLNAGAGFGVQLNNPDLISSTSKSIKSQYNAQTVSVKSTQPVYNDVNINFVTAIDFNYRIFNKVSITFTPTSRWYFKPVLILNNQATDELTLGFRSGIKLDF